jgi:hypothetical protein
MYRSPVRDLQTRVVPQKNGIEEGNTYHQLDLLGRAAVGVGGCRVVRFALAAGVHGGALRGAWLEG